MASCSGVVVGAGKASARMAEAVEAAWGPCEGLVITRYGYARACRGIEIVEAGPRACGTNMLIAGGDPPAVRVAGHSFEQ